MRDFSWKYFALTGNVDAFLLYKEMHQFSQDELASDGIPDELQEQGEEGAPSLV
ncbi:MULTISPECIES: YqzL family protein [Paenibacillus]|uniref:YqzL family protein n=1 Tax=Paenibacillus curdlanolyticus YK9 TaxID=717606 RepID=E0I3A8_9BACL|nr:MULTISPECIES: YqzL family protein [Paenibacillus]EFM12772.1 conserved hypothetical protein [Paenibacillus curdlanolyticus YK9]MWC27489.1 YqzL family protein [Paenibacillus sp. MMS18-CY102]